MIQKRTIGIVGAGHVGVAAAYAIFMAGLCRDLIVVDQDRRRAEGEAMDLMHAQAFARRVQVRAGSYRDLSPAQVVIVTAGAASRAGESRLALLARNLEVFRTIVRELDRHCREAVLIIASNPVDLMTHFCQRQTRRAASQVIGTGTMLDTARLRALLGAYYEVDPRSIHAYIIGEHGDSEVPLWSTAHIGGTPLEGHALFGKAFNRADMDRLFTAVRTSAYEIIARKGYTSSAIGLTIARLTAAVLNDENSVLPVSRKLVGEYGISDICLSIPSIVGFRGVHNALLPQLSPKEYEGLVRSADILKKHFSEIRESS